MSEHAADARMARLRSALFRVARGAVREPLVHFVLAGALVFAADHALRKDTDTIRVTQSVRDGVARTLADSLGRPPQASELQAGIEKWKEQQALYREGRNMGLLENDPVIEAHVASKLLKIARERTVFAPPTEAELRDFFDRHRAQYRAPPTYNFEQVFFSESLGRARERAEEALAKLRAGASPDGLGDWFPRGTRFHGETLADVSMLLGQEAGKEMGGYTAGEWHIVQGPRGFHLVRVDGENPRDLDFEQLRRAVAFDYEAEQREDEAEAYARRIESHYRFVDSP